MAKALKHDKTNAKIVSNTFFDSGSAKEDPWKSRVKAKDDPFFAVRSMVVKAPTLRTKTKDGRKVSINF